MISEILDLSLQQEPLFCEGQDATLRTCQLHQNLEFRFICTDPSRTDNAFKCDFCIEDQELDSRYLIPILQIQKCANKTVFYHWPLPESRELIREIQALSVRKKTDIQYREQIEKYFKELRIEVLAKIDAVQESMKKQAEWLWDFDERILQLYNEVSQKEVLKKLMSETSVEIDELSERVKKVIKEVLSHKQQNKKALEASLEELKLQESSVDFKQPQKIKLELLSKVSKITMFPIESVNQWEKIWQATANKEIVINLAPRGLDNTSQDSQENFKKICSYMNEADLEHSKEKRKMINKLPNLDEGEIEEIQKFINVLVESKKKRKQQKDQPNMKVSDIIKLIRCKANHTSDSTVSSIEKMLEGVKRYIETFEIEALHKEGYEQEQFSEFNDSEVKRIGEMAQEIKELLKDGGLNQQYLQEIVGVGKQIIQTRSQPQQQQQNHLIIEGIIDLVGNESNFCSKFQLDKITQALHGVKFYLESFQLEEIQTPRMSWKGLETQQLMNLGKLATQIRELNERHGEDYKNCKKPQKEQQDNSRRVCEAIKKEMYYLQEAQQQEVEQLLSIFPVFELTQTKWEGKSIKWRWILPGYKDSSGLQLEEEKNGVKVIQLTKLEGSAVCDTVLDNSLVYSVKCTFNKPISHKQHILIGLIPEDVIDTELVGYPNNRMNYYSSSGSTDYEIVKGQLLSSKQVWRTFTTIYFRFCIQTQSFYFADESLENITKVKIAYIDKNKKYRFGISFKASEEDFWFRFQDVSVYQNQSLVDMF